MLYFADRTVRHHMMALSKQQHAIMQVLPMRIADMPFAVLFNLALMLRFVGRTGRHHMMALDRFADHSSSTGSCKYSLCVSVHMPSAMCAYFVLADAALC
jgi:hypothetical protein